MVSGFDGLSAHNYGGSGSPGVSAVSVTITANGTIDAGNSAIESINAGTGFQTIIARSTITSVTEEGITAQNYGTNQTITTAAVTGHFVGIPA